MARRAAGGKYAEEFQRDLALQLFVAGAIHDAHPTFAELVFDDVVADPLTNHGGDLGKVDHTQGGVASKSLAEERAMRESGDALQAIGAPVHQHHGSHDQTRGEQHV